MGFNCVYGAKLGYFWQRKLIVALVIEINFTRSSHSCEFVLFFKFMKYSILY